MRGGENTNPPSPVAVTQADRDAAADWMSAQNYDWGYCDDVRRGNSDNGLLAAFARHREAEQERCARVAESRPFWTRDDGLWTPKQIAAEIRKGAS